VKTYKTIKSYKAVWAILKEMGLSHLFEGAAADKVTLPLGQIFDKLLEGNQAAEFMKAITRSDRYLPDGMDTTGGTPVATNKQAEACLTIGGTEWEDVEIEVLTELVKDFFSVMPGTLAKPALPGKSGAEAEAVKAEAIPSPELSTTLPASG